jgi:hypothetical protein
MCCVHRRDVAMYYSYRDVDVDVDVDALIYAVRSVPYGIESISVGGKKGHFQSRYFRGPGFDPLGVGVSQDIQQSSCSAKR